MEKLLMFLVICVFAKAMENRNHTKLLRAFEEYDRSEPEFEEGSACVLGDDERNFLTEEAKCGAPKKVFYSLKDVPRAAYEEIYPEAVWIKQCAGVCSDEGIGSKCISGKTVMRQIPIKKVNTETSKESCATTTVEEHEMCQCTAVGRSNWSKTGLKKYGKSRIAVF